MGWTGAPLFLREPTRQISWILNTFQVTFPKASPFALSSLDHHRSDEHNYRQQKTGGHGSYHQHWGQILLETNLGYHIWDYNRTWLWVKVQYCSHSILVGATLGIATKLV